MAPSVWRVFVASRDSTRQRLRSELENAPCKEENEERLDDTEFESQAAECFAMSAKDGKCSCGFLKAHLAVLARSMRAG